jgi:hypothetical protein
MYACISEIGHRFFEGVCRLEDRPLTFRDPSHHALPREVALNDTPWLPYRFSFRQNRGYGVRRTEEIQMGGLFLVSIDLSSDAENLHPWHHCCN